MSKIALVHDYFIQMGGAERVVEAIHDSFPAAPVYTTAALPQGLPKRLREADIRTSPLQHLPSLDRRFRQYFMLYPFAVEHFDLSPYDLIFSSSSGYAKGVHRRRNAVHVCYCYTPMRWVWRYDDYVAREGLGKGVRTLLPMLMWGLRKWDLRAAHHPLQAAHDVMMAGQAKVTTLGKSETQLGGCGHILRLIVTRRAGPLRAVFR